MTSLQDRLHDAIYVWLSSHPRTRAVCSHIARPLMIVFGYAIVALYTCVVWIKQQVKRVVKSWNERHLLKPDEIAEMKHLRQVRNGVRELPETRPRRLTMGKHDAPVLGTSGTEPESHAASIGEERRRHGKRRRRFRGGSSGAIMQVTIDQLGKSLFWRLPFEVREEIWKYAVGYNHIHIVRRRGRLGHVYCPADDPTDPLRRDLCLESRDEQGFYRPTAWPRDIRPLSLLLSCRQIYSECIDLVYLLNTFAFDEPSTMHTFLTRLVPHRKRLVSHVRISPNFGSDLYIPMLPTLTQTYRPSTRDSTMWMLPKLRSLTVTPSFHRLAPLPDASGQLVDSIQSLLLELQSLDCETPCTLWWPGPNSRAHSGSSWWGRDDYLPPSLKCNLRRIPELHEVILLAFLFPLHVRCLHCASYTLIRKTTLGYAEASYFSDATATGALVPVRSDPTLARYSTFHTPCGGWLELEFDFRRGAWSVTQGGSEVADAEAAAHVAAHGERYAPLPNPHRALRGLAMREGFGGGSAQAVDWPTYETFSRNMGWRRMPMRSGRAGR